MPPSCTSSHAYDGVDEDSRSVVVAVVVVVVVDVVVVVVVEA